MPSNYYGGIIWTNHALDRLKRRGLTQDIAAEAFKYPDRTFQGKRAGTHEYQKRIGQSLVTLITTQNEKNEWIVLSAWIDPPLPGSADAKEKESYKRLQKASFLGKFWYTLLRQIGL